MFPGFGRSKKSLTSFNLRHSCAHIERKQQVRELRSVIKKKKKGMITIDSELCKGCYWCISVCPEQLIVISDKLNQKGYHPVEFTEADAKEEDRRCTGCAQCATVCPDIAIEVYRE